MPFQHGADERAGERGKRRSVVGADVGDLVVLNKRRAADAAVRRFVKREVRKDREKLRFRRRQRVDRPVRFGIIAKHQRRAPFVRGRSAFGGRKRIEIVRHRQDQIFRAGLRFIASAFQNEAGAQQQTDEARFARRYHDLQRLAVRFDQFVKLRRTDRVRFRFPDLQIQMSVMKWIGVGFHVFRTLGTEGHSERSIQYRSRYRSRSGSQTSDSKTPPHFMIVRRLPSLPRIQVIRTFSIPSSLQTGSTRVSICVA